MRPASSQPARLFATAKMHKFTNLKQININAWKLPPIIDKLVPTYTHDCSKIIAQYLQPLAIDKYTISDTLSFTDILRENPLDSNVNLTLTRKNKKLKSLHLIAFKKYSTPCS